MARILIIDDSKTMRSLLKAMLKTLGHEVVGEATNGLEGYDKYFELKPDLVTMDLTMPILDGVSALQKIKEIDPDAKIIILTSNAQSERLAGAVDAGASGYIFKPVKESDLLKTLEQVLHAD